MAYRLDAALGEVTLLGLSLGRLQAAPGDLLHLTTFWRADRSPDAIYTVYADLVDGLGQTVATHAFLPGAPQHATHRWQEGEVVRDQQVWVLPQDVVSGQYGLRFRVADGEGQAQGVAWLEEQKLAVVALERQTEVPAMQQAVGANFADRATLLGYDLRPATPQPGETLQLTLYWRAEREMSRSYKVFAHLLDAEGRVSAQRDAVPADWTRPTTGWLPGEIVTDSHELALEADTPPGEYLLEVGLYEERTATRLPLLDGAGQTVGDRLLLEAVKVEP
jgi:hypothetical protein